MEFILGSREVLAKWTKRIKRGFNTLAYTTEEIQRIAEVGFETAKARSKKLCSVDKANVLESTQIVEKCCNRGF